MSARSSVQMSASAAAFPSGDKFSMGSFGGQPLGANANNMFGDLASKVGTAFQGIDNSQFAQKPQQTPSVSQSFTPNNLNAFDMSSSKTKSGASGVTSMMNDGFKISGSSQPTQMLKNYQ